MSTIIITVTFAFLTAYINYGRWLFKKLSTENVATYTQYVPRKQETNINKIKRACTVDKADNPIISAVSGWIPVLLWIIARSLFRSVRKQVISLCAPQISGYSKVSRKLAACLTVFSMIISLIGGIIPVYAAEDSVHLHDTVCGYIEGGDCTHECNEDCTEGCIHIVHDEECGYIDTAPCTYEDDDELNLIDEVDSCVCEALCSENSVNTDCSVCVDNPLECFHYYCYCETECTEDNQNTDCPVCKDDYNKCAQAGEVSEIVELAESDIDGLKDAATNGGTYNLTADISIEDVYGTEFNKAGLHVESNLTIDLKGKNLTITVTELSNGIKIADDKTLTIKDSSENKSGTLTVNNNVTNAGGIGLGAGINTTDGTLIIENGTVIAKGSESLIGGGAGIGGGEDYSGTGIGGGGNVTINGGSVTATGDTGIGGSGGTVKINGGSVTATGSTGIDGMGGAGIGGSGGTVEINGGSVTAIGGNCDYNAGGAGIGGGANGSGGDVIISGGTVTATGGVGGSVGEGGVKDGAGIGSGGYYSSGGNSNVGTLKITGGSIKISGESICAATPKNASGTNIYLSTLTLVGVTAVTKVTNITAPINYGITDVYTDASKLYFYLPEATDTDVSLTASNKIYSGTVSPKTDNTAEADLTAENDITVAHTVTAIPASSSPIAGASNNVVFTVLNSAGATDTTFTGTKNVTIKGVTAAPKGSYGSFNNIALTSDSVSTGQVIEVTFTNGTATVPLCLNNAAVQTVTFEVADVTTTLATQTGTITPTFAAASEAKITTQPSGAVSGVALTTQPVVHIVDQYENIVTDSSLTVTATITTNGSSTPTISAGATATASGGIATFSGLTLTTPSNGVVLTFTPAGLTKAASTAFNVTVKTVPTATDLDYTLTDTTYNKTQQSVSITPKTGVTGIGTVTVKYNDSSTVPTNAGTYTITVDIAEGTDYTPVTGIVIGDWTIAQAPLTITAEGKAKLVGEQDPAFTYTTNGLLTSDTLTGSLSRVMGERVGNYPIVLGNLNNANYAINFMGNYLTIKEQDSDPVPTLYTVNGTVTNTLGTGTVTVTIMQGNKIFGTSTGDNYSFASLAAGAYNITATNGTNSKTVYKELTSNAIVHITIDTKSVEVEVKNDDTPPVVVNVTALENKLGQVQASLKLVVDTTTAPLLITNMAETAGQTIAFNLDFSIVKDGVSQSTYEFDDIITATFPIPDAAKGRSITVYRLHGGVPSVMPEMANADGEYVEIGADFITLHVKKFSDYSVAYTALTKTITANAGTGGTISPFGSITVNEGENKTFTISSNSGYSISDVKVDGVSVGKVSTYTFNNVTTDHTIEATFYYSYGLTNAATPVITTQPTVLSAFVGETKKLNVAAKIIDGGTLSYQWYLSKSSDKTGATAISGATNADYIVPTDKAGTYYYYVVVTNTNNSVRGSKTADVTSNAVTVTIAKQFTVTYKVNGGIKVSGMPSDTTKYDNGKTVTVKGTPVSTSKFFDSWNTKADGTGISYTNKMTLKITEDITLYAQWKDTITSTASKLIYQVTGKNKVVCIGTEDNEATTISIPNTVKYKGITYKITRIAKNSFRDNEKITTVKIGNNIKIINKTAFYNCPNLKKVTIGTGLVKLGNHAFCHAKDGCVIIINSTKLKTVKTAINHGTKNMVVKVPKNKLNAYKKLFAIRPKISIISFPQRY